MKVERAKLWPTAAAYETSSRAGRCPWVGISIGPRSDEGAVLVNAGGEEFLLEAGGVCPIAAPQYRLMRVHRSGEFASIDVLEVCLYESADEMATARGRAPRLYSGTVSGTSVASDAAFTSLLVVPFVSRERARVVVRTAAALPGIVRVSGRYWSTARGAIETVILREEVAVVPDDDANSKFAYVIGGTDQAEHWTELHVEGQLSAGGAAELWTCDALVSGEAA